MPEAIYVTTMNEVIIQERVKRAMVPRRMMPNRPKGTKFIIRRRPAPKKIEAWEVFDARTSKLNPSVGEFYSPPECVATVDNRDAAIGYALIMP